MSNIFLVSDHHFHHENILTFKRSDGTPLREFKSVSHMNEHIVNCHNSVVGPKDKVYFLGDVTMSKTAASLEILARMNGEKVLIKGNHDLCTTNQYLRYFKDIRACHQLDKLILTHIPIHIDSLARWRANVHGHLHYQRVMQSFGTVPDKRYFNVSVECINYTPISLEEINKQLRG